MIKPGLVFHPGEYLIDAIKQKGITQKQFADITGISKYEINDIIKGRRNITPRLAFRFGVALQTPSEARLNLQNLYDLHILNSNKEEVSYKEIIQKKLKSLIPNIAYTA